MHARRLYPRALLTPFTDNVDLTEADRLVYTGYAQAQGHKGFQSVDVTFDESRRGRRGREKSVEELKGHDRGADRGGDAGGGGRAAGGAETRGRILITMSGAWGSNSQEVR